MNMKQEHVEKPRGFVHAGWIARNYYELIAARSNVIAYGAADILAELVAGRDAAPKHIGFIYGSVASPGLADPDTLPVETKRVHPWSTIASDIAAIPSGGNIAIAPLVLPASAAADIPTLDRYANNKATFVSHTGARMEYGFTPGVGGFAASVDDLLVSGNVYFYQAVLLNRQQVGRQITYRPFARVSLAPYTPKPVGKELAVFWDIIFK